MKTQEKPKTMDPREYHGWKFDRENPQEGPISCSLLKEFADKGPLAFRHAPERKATSAMGWGSMVDCLLTAPELFPREFVAKEDCPDLSADGGFRSKAAREWRDEVTESGVTLIGAEAREKAEQAVERARNTPIVADVLAGAAAQVMVRGDAAGIPTKSLLDLVPEHLDFDDCLADVKTTSANVINDDEIAAQVGRWRYHWQAAFYLHQWNRAHPDDKRRRFVFVWISSSPPYECRVDELSDMMLDEGRSKVAFWMGQLVARCKSGFWGSPLRNRVGVIEPHNPTIWAEEARMEAAENWK